MKRNALVFDLDGTLVDSAAGLQAALNLTLREIGCPPLALAAVRGMIGDGVPMLVRRGLAASGAPEAAFPDRLARFLAIYEADPASGTRPYPGVADVLAALRAEGRRLAICTNKPQRATGALLEALDLDRVFTAILGGDAVAFRKPDPRHILATLAALGAAPGDAVMIGDNEHDAAAAKAAGIPVILARYGYARVPLQTLGADAEIDAFADLPQALAALESGAPEPPPSP